MVKINITNMQKDLEFIKEQDGITGISTEGCGGSTNAISNITQRTALYNLDERNKLEKKIQKAQMDIDRIDRALEGLNDTQRNIVEGFYIGNLMWWQVAYGVKYSESHCKKVGARAIRELVKGIYGTKS